ncbi:protein MICRORCHIDIA 1-like isoform X2 [Zingiber officinale]|uniref:protein MICRORCHIDIA 1-like isoform X2 n=1 Tax=Zingiber officinale TaxID=94328 RepID=UPI001C4D0B37|nr:protein MICRORCHIDIA 1-like isoform X2 [Zingiber officinale]
MPPTESPGDDMVVLGSPADGGVNRVRSLVAPEGDEAQKGRRVLECRNFWRAGAYEVRSGVSPSARHAAQESSDFDRARVHPKFLHTNATSHKWAFGAIAELLDNSVDEIQNGATFVKVDKVSNSKDNSPMLLFQDDGGGMDPEGIRRCMSLGFSTKRSKTTIGQYGNGFKTSTMRLGADAIVFSRANRGGNVTLCIGLLSYTFLRRTMKDDIIVPMLDFHIVNGQKTPIILSSQDEWDSSLKAILDWSPFSSMEELLLQFEDMGLHGTKVVVYNLWMNDDGLLELDFDDDDQDILLRDQAYSGGFTRANKEVVHCHVSSRLKYSLRAYASILYMRKFSNFHIILRGKPVEQVSIADELKFIKTITYKPQVGMDGESVSVRITIGFAKEAPVLGIFGVNVYHKNRLIMPYWKVVQEGSSRGRCVVGIFEANFIEPAHDKQDFERTPLFIRLESKLRQIILEYWKYNCHLIGYQSIDITTEKRKLKESEKHSDRHASKVQLKVPTPIGVACSHLQPTGQTHAQSHDTMPISGEDDDDIEIIDVQDPSLIKKITEENIQLFMRREELQQTTNQLRRTVEELEHELAEVKKKCSQLAADLQIRGGKQHILGTNQS